MSLNFYQLVSEFKYHLIIVLGEVTISPEFDPFYQDIKLKDRIDASDSNEEKNKIKQQAIDYTKRKNISIVGVRKIGKTENKKFYNIENFDFSYSYNEIYHHDYEIENQKNKNIDLQKLWLQF